MYLVRCSRPAAFEFFIHRLHSYSQSTARRSDTHRYAMPWTQQHHEHMRSNKHNGYDECFCVSEWMSVPLRTDRAHIDAERMCFHCGLAIWSRQVNRPCNKCWSFSWIFAFETSRAGSRSNSWCTNVADTQSEREQYQSPHRFSYVRYFDFCVSAWFFRDHAAMVTRISVDAVWWQYVVRYWVHPF